VSGSEDCDVKLQVREGQGEKLHPPSPWLWLSVAALKEKLRGKETQVLPS
jgi:hypothetical protein